MIAPDARELLAERMRLMQSMHRRLVHEVRGKLNSVVMHLELLSAGAGSGGGESRAQDIATLRRSLDDVQEIALRSLELAKTWDVRATPFDAGDLLDDTAAFLSRTARSRGVDLLVTRPPGGPFVKASRDAIAFVALALSWDAIQEGDSGARIEISVTRADDGVRLEWHRESPAAENDVASSKAGGFIDIARKLVESSGGRLEGPDGTLVARLDLPADPYEAD